MSLIPNLLGITKQAGGCAATAGLLHVQSGYLRQVPRLVVAQQR
jgi:hypothetical protein